MKGTNKVQLRRLAGLAAKAFIMASVVAVVLPMPQYAHSLDHGQHIIWMARLSWVLLLSLGFVAVLLLAGILTRRIQRKSDFPT